MSVEIGDDVDTIDADELRFKQVLLNLLSNAVKFTPDGGSVEVRANRAEGQLVVTVPTRVGDPAEDRERIFESFQQGGRGVARRKGPVSGFTLNAADRRALLPGAVGSGSSRRSASAARSASVPGSVREPPLKPSQRRRKWRGRQYCSLMMTARPWT